MSANALVRGSRTSALLNVLEPSPGVSQLLPAQPSKRHARTVSSQCGNDFLHLPSVHVQTFPSNQLIQPRAIRHTAMEAGSPPSKQTTRAPRTRSTFLRGGRDRGIKAGGITVEIDELDATGTAHQCVIAPRFEKAVDHCLVLQVRALDDQSEVVRRHFGYLLSALRLAASWPCGHLPISRRSCLAWSTGLRGVDQIDAWQRTRFPRHNP